MGYTFDDIAAAAEDGLIRISAETVGYLVLAVAGHVSPSDRLSSRDLVLEQSGGVTPLSNPEGREPEPLLRSVLGGFLRFSGTENAALSECADDPCTGLGPLRATLEAALVPINRAAAKRSLMRLHRELARTCSDRPQKAERRAWLEESVEPFLLTQVKAPRATVAPVAPPSVPMAHRTPILGTQVREKLSTAERDTTPVVPQVFDVSATPFMPPSFEPISGKVPAPPITHLAKHQPLRSDISELLSAITDEALDLPFEALAAS